MNKQNVNEQLYNSSGRRTGTPCASEWAHSCLDIARFFTSYLDRYKDIINKTNWSNVFGIC